MAQCIVLSITGRDEWTDQVRPHPQGMRAEGRHVPPKYRPSLVHPTRAAAEKEAARLACSTGGYGGEFAVFELVAVVAGKVLADTDRVRGTGPCGAFVPRWDDECPEI